MSQDYQKPIPGQTPMGQLYGLLGASLDTLRSQFSGASFPDSPLVGQPCFRTDRGTGVLYVYTGNPELGEAGWVDYALASLALSNLKHELGEARGSAPSLKARLNVALNDDGTLKGDAPAGDWWTAEADALAYVSESTFSVAGDKRGIYMPGRAVRLEQAVNGYGHVAEGIAYDEAADLTTVEVTGCAVDSGLSVVEYGQDIYNVPSPEKVGAATPAQLEAAVQGQAVLLRLTALTGGAPGALDAMPHASIADSELAIVEIEGQISMWRYHADSMANPDGRTVIVPADGSAYPGRWHRSYMDADDTGGAPIGTLFYNVIPGYAPPLCIATSGQLLPRTDYPELWAKVESSAVSEYNWQNAGQGCFSVGDGVSTFRVPLINAEFVRALDRGRGVDAGRGHGSLQSDAIRNIVGSFGAFVTRDQNHYASGAFQNPRQGSTWGVGTSGSGVSTISFNAALVVPTANENRPRNIAYPAWIKYA
ncbi:hypothetical protein [Desulfocurvibacter africanus]|uniref:hypothetical protein n=1 Tax=Desulfocurvibacter africanus TaxID=873 RepID=UPI00041064E5|nr:hypothetical protein [Desulfocurvibacter africanus]